MSHPARLHSEQLQDIAFAGGAIVTVKFTAPQ
jgi:hypothetical protein